MAESIDKLPLGIYKSIMTKAFNSLNRKVFYEERIRLQPSVFKATEMYSPCRNTDYDLELIKKRKEAIKYRKERYLASKKAFMVDYLNSL